MICALSKLVALADAVVLMIDNLESVESVICVL